ncbi:MULTISPECIES: M10 family metallopeptidase [unclassified Phaeobacter]|uniref:M10 family metallopeptidase n=2 Tax=Phaeobacter TaxID=302485 RepID=UPI003A87B929
MPLYQDYRALLVSNTDGWHDGDDTISYGFVSQVPGYYPYDPAFDDYAVRAGYIPASASVAMDARQQALMLQSVAAWNEVANVNLTPAGPGDVLDIAFASYGFDNTGLFGFVANFPDADDLGTEASMAGDLWINSSNPNQYVPGIGPILGHTSWNTYLHELGHALGLRHPNEQPSDAATNGQFTVMSYVAHPGEADLSYDAQGWALTPMLWDMQALQALYGANTSTRTDATSYFGAGDGRGGQAYQYGADEMTLRGADGVARNVSLTIWDAGGADLIDASDLGSNSRIDLCPGQYSTIGSLENNVAMAAAVQVDGRTVNLIEDAWGGAGDDLLIGNEAANTLVGNAGRDTLKGGAGQDRLEGGEGNDRMAGGQGADVFVFSQGADVVIDFQAEDRIDMSAATGVLDFADLREDHLEIRNADLVIRDDNGWSLTLQNTAFEDLRADDILF